MTIGYHRTLQSQTKKTMLLSVASPKTLVYDHFEEDYFIVEKNATPLLK